MSQEANLRKSSRQPVPNRIYSQGISQLKKESTIKNKKKPKSSLSEDYYSYEESQRIQVYESQEPFLDCILPDGYRRRIQFVFQMQDAPPIQPKKQIVRPQPVAKPQKKAQQGPTSLLSMFQQAIEDPDLVGEQKDDQGPKIGVGSMYESKIIPAPAKVKKIRDISQGYIKSLKIQQQEITIQHSILGKIQIPIDWKEPLKSNPEPTQDDLFLKKKLSEYKGISKISIFSQ